MGEQTLMQNEQEARLLIVQKEQSNEWQHSLLDQLNYVLFSYAPFSQLKEQND